jgi:hypothetical protein
LFGDIAADSSAGSCNERDRLIGHGQA